jgi:hypothetical protein
MANIGTGKGGKSLQDRELAARVRTLALSKIEEILSMPIVKMKSDDYALYKEILVKLSGSVLPRLNEVTGEGGNPIEASIIMLPQRNADKPKP